METKRLYDVAISYVGKHRVRAQTLADALERRDLACFFDRAHEAKLLGTNLQDRLWDIYRDQAHHCVVLHSEHYGNDTWTKLERRAIEDRALADDEYVFLVKLDSTKIQGVLSTTKYLEWPPRDENYIADVILAKLNKQTPNQIGNLKPPTYLTSWAAAVRGIWKLLARSNQRESEVKEQVNTFRLMCLVAILMTLIFVGILKWWSTKAAQNAANEAHNVATKTQQSLEHFARLAVSDIVRRRGINDRTALGFWRTDDDQERVPAHVEVARSDTVAKNCFDAGHDKYEQYDSLIGCAIEQNSLVYWRSNLKSEEPASWSLETGKITGVGKIDSKGRPFILLANSKKCVVPEFLNGDPYYAKALMCLGGTPSGGNLPRSGVCLSTNSERDSERMIETQYLYSALWAIQKLPDHLLNVEDKRKQCKKSANRVG